MARRKPQRVIVVRYEVTDAGASGPSDDRVLNALRASSLEASTEKPGEWEISLAVQTRVYGVVAREVDESLYLRLDDTSVIVECHPIETHVAHSAGLAGVLLIALTAWVAGGLFGGIAAAVAVLAAGVLTVEVTRHWAVDALERKIHQITVDLGSALWPGIPAQVLEENRSI